MRTTKRCGSPLWSYSDYLYRCSQCRDGSPPLACRSARTSFGGDWSCRSSSCRAHSTGFRSKAGMESFLVEDVEAPHSPFAPRWSSPLFVGVHEFIPKISQSSPINSWVSQPSWKAWWPGLSEKMVSPLSIGFLGSTSQIWSTYPIGIWFKSVYIIIYKL